VSLIGFLVGTGQKEEARGELARAEKLLSGTKGMVALAQCYEAVGEAEKAAKIYASPDVAESKDLAARRAVAVHQLRAGNAKKAEDHLKYIVRVAGPQDREAAAWAKGMLAVLATLTGNYTDAQQALAALGGSAADKSPEGLAGRRTQAALLASRGNRRDRLEAIRLVEELIDDGVDQPPDRLLLSQLYEANNEWPRARKQLTALRKMPRGDSLPILVAYAAAMLRNGEPDEAEEALKKVDMAAADNLAVVALRAQLLHRRDKAAEAVALLRGHVMKQDKSYGQVAALLESLKETRAAEEMYRRHAEKSPNPAAQLALAGFLGRQKRAAEALDICERAWGKAPTATVADTCLLILERADERVWDRVDRQLQAALRKEPKSADLRLALAHLRLVQAQYAEAERLYRELIRETRDNLLARNNLAWMLAAQKDRGEDALRLIEEAIRIGGPQPFLLDTKAVAFITARKTKEAIAILDGLVKESPKEATYHLHLAQAHAADKNKRAALLSLKLAQDAGVDPDALHPLERQAYARLLRDLGLGLTSLRE
jgi:predicted Zn-dependent protease